MTITPRRKKLYKGNSGGGGDMGGRYYCDYCRKDITDGVRIRCAVCANFDLCVECFSVGVEIVPHKNDHNYRVMRQFDFPSFTLDWSAEEELLLLEGIELYGLGNWMDIAEHLGTRSKQECEEHYLDVYIRVDTCPLPNMGFHCSKELIEEHRRRKKEKEQISLSDAKKPIEEVKAPGQSHPANHEIAGFMPFRKDFETEYDNDAEEMVKDMVFNEDDAPDDINLKLAILEIYNTKLDARLERKRFVFDRDLTDFKKQQAVERKRTKEEREVHNQMRIFARFLTKQDYDAFVDGLVFEQRVRNRIAQLQEYRQQGVKTLLAGDIFEGNKRKRETELSLRKSKENSSYLYTDRIISTPRQGRTRERDESTVSSASSMGTISKIPRKAITPLDIASAESVELLSLRERELCAQIRLLPKAYLSIKELMIKEYNRLGSLRRSHARSLVRIDVNKTGRIYDFCVAAGWVSRELLE